MRFLRRPYAKFATQPHYTVKYNGRNIAAIFIARENMPKDISLALDRKSVRSKDDNGYLRVEKSNISKANVCGYYGQEIPGWENLGLEPDRLYMLYRDPAELAKAKDTFKGIPLLNKHTPVSSSDLPRENIVGSVGSNVEFDGTYLTADIIVHDDTAIAGIEQEIQRELSPGYRYRPDMTSGFAPDGTPYDGVMRDISGNHLALVEVGRTGSDVVIGDENPGDMNMSKAQKQFEQLKKKGLIAQDADPKAVLAALATDADPDDEDEDDEGVAEDEQTEAERDNESEAERLKEREERERKDRKEDQAEDESCAEMCEDEDEDDCDPKGKPGTAMDASAIERRVMKRYMNIRQAEADVKPLVGEVSAMDSAAQVYHFALDAAGVKGHKQVKDVGALKAMVAMAVDSKASRNDFAQDAARPGRNYGKVDLGQLFPSLKKRS